MDRKEKYRQSMLKRFNGDEAALLQWYQQNQAKSRQHPNNKAGSHRGGFSDKAFARKMVTQRHQQAKEDKTD